MSGGALIGILMGTVHGNLSAVRAGVSVASRRKARISVYSDKRVTRWDSHPECERKPRHLTTNPLQCSVGLASYVGRAKPPTPRCAARLADAPPLLHQPWPEESEHLLGQPRNPWSFPRSTHSPARLRGCAPASSHVRLETKLLALWCAQPHLAPPVLHSRCRPTAGTPACSGTAGTRNTPRSAAPGT